MHLTRQLPNRFARGDVRSKEKEIEIIRTNGKYEVRNEESEDPLRSYEVPFPPLEETDPDFLSVIALWEDTDFGVHSFEHFDRVDGEKVVVRFDGKLQVTHIDGPYYRIDTMVLVEVAA